MCRRITASLCYCYLFFLLHATKSHSERADIVAYALGAKLDGAARACSPSGVT